MLIDPPESGSAEGPTDRLDATIPPRPDAPVSQQGDIWTMGEHRLHVASLLESASFEALMAGRKAAMVFQDVPYNVPISGHVSGLGKVQHREFAMAAGEMSADQFLAFNTTNLQVTAAHLIDGAILAMCIDWRGLLTLQLAMREARLDFINLAV